MILVIEILKDKEIIETFPKNYKNALNCVKSILLDYDIKDNTNNKEFINKLVVNKEYKNNNLHAYFIKEQWKY